PRTRSTWMGRPEGSCKSARLPSARDAHQCTPRLESVPRQAATPAPRRPDVSYWGNVAATAETTSAERQCRLLHCYTRAQVLTFRQSGWLRQGTSAECSMYSVQPWLGYSGGCAQRLAARMVR